ncbi:hypothetical protein [Ruminococcus flavefaciens]|uniref:Uncharacterized protein n=2 Tax=Ruminococcus TaxID=1263 RepID=A0A1M7JZG5_RUMFL|nr:hypothetical protein [Ruminococcus flavefaciens]SHM58429.1 hypothetical protein SAMN04487860_1077 [Ruminococcus flavefaciens]
MDTLKASNFIKNNARPLEKALYSYFYENGTRGKVIHELLKYMNDDCGFGNALEPDNWNRNSTPITVNDAVMTLFKTGALDEKSRLTDRIAHYLSSHDGFDEDKKRWLFAVESNKDFPHAVWWEKKGDGIRGFNPTVSLAAFMCCFSEERSYYMQIVLEAFQSLSEQEEMIADDLKCYLLAYELMERHGMAVIGDSGFDAKNFLCKKLGQVICGDISKYGVEYVPVPSDFFCGIFGQFITDDIRPLIKAEREVLGSLQLDDGGFDISWQWHNDYEEFGQAREWWRPRVTLDKLLFYKYNA